MTTRQSPSAHGSAGTAGQAPARRGRPPGRRRSTADATGLDAVVDALELDIVLGRLRPQSRLVEDELMARFQAKRHVVRSALDALTLSGLVERRPNKGAVVRDYGLEEVLELYAFRADLHRLAVEKMVLPLSAAVVERLAAEAQAHEAAIAAGDLASVIRRNDAFHEHLFGACPNRYVVEGVRRLDAASRAIRSRRIGSPERLRQAAAEHRLMVEAGAAGDRPALADLCVRHIVPSLQLFLSEQPAAFAAGLAGDDALPHDAATLLALIAGR